MEKQLIISVSREFGSGGHEIAEKLAKHYNLQLLDHDLLDHIVQDKNVNMDHLKEMDEKHTAFQFKRNVRGFSSSLQENVSLMQFDFLQDKAEAGDSFVIVGRCSEEILKDYDGLVSFFVLADKETKLKRIMERHNIPANKAKNLMRETDWKRKRYHNEFCELKWGDSRNYDICINSATLGIDATVEMLIDFIDRKMAAK